MEKISQRLKYLRDLKGMTMKDVATYLGISVSTYRDWEYGKSIQGEPYVKIAELFNVSVHELLTGNAPQLSDLVGDLMRIQEDLNKIIVSVKETVVAENENLRTLNTPTEV